MESIYPKKRKKTGQVYDDGTTSYKATAAAGDVGISGPAAGAQSGVDTTTPYAHSPATNMYYNSQNLDRQGPRGEGWKQYGLESDYYKGLDEKGKIDFIGKLHPGNNMGERAQQVAAASDKLGQWGGNLAATKKGTAAYAGKAIGQGAETWKNKMIDKAYQKAAGHAYEERKVDDDVLLSQLGQSAPHTQWREIFDNVTGKSMGYAEKDMKSGRGGWWAKANERNPDAMQAGIGAITGALTGGIPGAIVGAASGWYSGDKAKEAQELAKKEQDAINRLNIKNNINPNRPRMMRDIARSRAAGAGTFNYTDRVEG